jgi:hypothetical protein
MPTPSDKPIVVLLFETEASSAGLIRVVSSDEMEVQAHFVDSRVNTLFVNKVDKSQVFNLLNRRADAVSQLLTILQESLKVPGTEPITVARDFVVKAVEATQEEEPFVVDHTLLTGEFDEELGEIETKPATPFTENESQEAQSPAVFGDDSAFFDDGIVESQEAA